MDGTIIAVNLIVLATVLESDLFTRKVTAFRIARPVVAAAVVIPLFLKNPSTHGAGLGLEVGLTALGVALALLACRFMPVWWDEAQGRVRSRGTWLYAGVWTAVIAARLLFSYETQHGYRADFYTWLFDRGISGDAFAAAMIMMAFAMTLTRTALLVVRSRQVRPRARTERARALAGTGR